MSEIKVGDRVTAESQGRVRAVFTVERIKGDWIYGDHEAAKINAVRPWRPGDDEEAQRLEDQLFCGRFPAWTDLSSEDAAAVAAILRKYTPRTAGGDLE